MSKRLAVFLIIGGILASAAGTAFAYRVTIREAIESALKSELPTPRPYVPPPPPTAERREVSQDATSPGASPERVRESKDLSAPKPAAESTVNSQLSTVTNAVNFAVPFTSQAPFANWELPYQEACEEASLIMLNAYLAGVEGFTPEEADRQILRLVEWEKKTFGYYEDTTAEETARIAREYFGLKNSRAVPIASIDDVKNELVKGNPVIVPAAGRLLKNPYFRGQGPLYHMLVVKGFTKDGKIITNDPGTRRGADFLYDPVTLWNAIHDWNGGDVANGQKMMIVLER